MREQKFKDWLEAYRSKAGNPLAQTSKNAYFRDNQRAEDEDSQISSLDNEFDKDKMESLLERYAYSQTDQHNGRANPTDLDIATESLYNSLASHRTAFGHYRRFRSGIMTP
ncbi:MAG: hypothetical protein ACNYPD_03325 [Candidatus Halichondribacter symbioticus]